MDHQPNQAIARRAAAVMMPLIALVGLCLVASACQRHHTQGSPMTTPASMVQPANPVAPRVFPEGPRKAIIATSIFCVYPTARPWQGLDHRLDDIARRIDDMAADADARHGRGMDLAIFPENAINPRGRRGSTLADRAVSLQGKVQQTLAAKARQHNTYLVVSFNMLETDGQTVSNAAVLFDRQGEIAGIYRKVFLSGNNPKSNQLEGGKQPGTDFPVFDTDFGRIAIMICWDMGYDDMFEAYRAQGVELIAWPSMSPQTFLPRMYGWRYGMYIASATPRDNASVIDPAGRIAATTTEKEGILTHEIDLDYRILHWQPNLNDGRAFTEAFGDRVGYHYDPGEDTGIFWSNDPATPISQMIESLGFITEQDVRDRSRHMRDQAMQSTD